MVIKKPSTLRRQKRTVKKKSNLKPVALILAGYNKIASKKKKKRFIEEMQEAYDGEIIFIGQNKFLKNVAGMPVIQYVIDAVYNAKKSDTGGNKKTERLYDKIYVYNDIKSISKSIDLSRYPHLIIRQMKESVGGHLKDFCKKFIEYGQRVDIFFGDTPRLATEDVEWIHNEYNNILGRMTDERGIPITLIYSLVDYKNLKDNWLRHRLKFIKHGHNKGKLKSFIGFENSQSRIGNSAAFLMHKSLNGLIENEAINLFYNLRKALNPSNLSKIIYHFWKTKHFKLIKQIKNKCINELEIINAVKDVVSRLYKIDLSNFGIYFYHIKKNASRWENDIDSPLDLEAIDKKFRKTSRR
ncbi:MAG: hypothetical protein JXN64_01255 [Spirochaetes bacterium]|nr:hypothetical protein [Spirochaetota bacterium]